MDHRNLFVFAVLIFSSYAEAAECEIGWLAYKDELCVKSFPNLVNYEEAKALCASQSSEISQASLVMVKDEDMQNLLVEYTNEEFDNAWLGSRYDEATSEFIWEDGEPLSYTNWDVDYPRITDPSNACVELRPINAKRLVKADGKWTDGNCQKRNMVICQKTLSWSLQDAINEIIKIRKQHQDDLENVYLELEDSKNDRSRLQGEIQATQQDLRAAQTEIQTVSSRVVPVGSIYIEYYNQPSPRTLWPSLQWQDISSTYAGLFFRTSGGTAASWGSTQAECVPRLAQIEWQQREESNSITLPANGWSPWVSVGFNDYGGTTWRAFEATRFYTAGCEVRPKNQAIRIWKRTG